MTGTVLDASALLTFVQGGGAEAVEAELVAGARCGTANWSEVAQKIHASGRDWPLVRALLLSYPLALEPVCTEDGEQAALRWSKGEGLSLADRLCLALAERLDTEAWTADRSWGTTGRVRPRHPSGRRAASGSATGMSDRWLSTR